MESLNHNWLTEGLVDFEFKKYTLLAYLKHIKKKFKVDELYPFMSDLAFHYRNLAQIKSGRELISAKFPKELSKADFNQLKLTYKLLVEDDEVMNEIKEIIEFALPNMQQVLEEGRGLHEFVEEQMDLSPVGVNSLYENEGYILINVDHRRDVQVYRYQISIFENSHEKYRGINTTFLGEDFQDFSRSYERIKLDLVKEYPDLPSPATFLLATKQKFPMQETILPVAKRMLIKRVNNS
ncbi:MAG: hypothetical protein ACJAVY_001237 [Marinoscillum sp.]|jgi:hypothetical protein